MYVARVSCVRPLCMCVRCARMCRYVLMRIMYVLRYVCASAYDVLRYVTYVALWMRVCFVCVCARVAFVMYACMCT